MAIKRTEGIFRGVAALCAAHFIKAQPLAPPPPPPFQRIPLCPQCPAPEEPLEDILRRTSEAGKAFAAAMESADMSESDSDDSDSDSDDDGSDDDAGQGDGKDHAGTGKVKVVRKDRHSESHRDREVSSGRASPEDEGADCADAEGAGPAAKKTSLPANDADASTAATAAASGSSAAPTAATGTEGAAADTASPYPATPMLSQWMRHTILGYDVPIMKPDITFFHEDLSDSFYGAPPAARARWEEERQWERGRRGTQPAPALGCRAAGSLAAAHAPHCPSFLQRPSLKTAASVT